MREKHWLPLIQAQIKDWTHNLGICPDWESNLQHLCMGWCSNQLSLPTKLKHAIFLNHFLLIMLVQLSQFFPLCVIHPATHRPSPHHCSCPWVMHVSSLATPFPIIFFTSKSYSVTTYLYFLIPSPLHPFPDTTSHLANIKTPSIPMILSLFLFA